MAPLQRLRDAISPTPSNLQSATKIVARQATTTVVTTDSGSGNVVLSGGAIAGIVIGSIAGFLLILWLIRSCSNLGQPGLWGNTFGSREHLPTQKGVEPVYVRQSHGGHHHHHHQHRSRSRHSQYDRSPRRSVEVRNMSTTRPIYVERGRSPRAPQPAYQARSSREARRSRRGSGAYYG